MHDGTDCDTACRHCRRARPIRARGLCKPCWRQPQVRVQYPKCGPPPAPPPGAQPCRHCGAVLLHRSQGRGLCDACHADRAVRARYPKLPGPLRLKTSGEPCRHCGERFANRPRRLCFRCYHQSDVRRLYAPIGPGGLAGARKLDCNGGYDPPAEATDAEPGSRDKVDVLAARYAAGTVLFHADDVRTMPVRAWVVPVCRAVGVAQRQD